MFQCVEELGAELVTEEHLAAIAGVVNDQMTKYWERKQSRESKFMMSISYIFSNIVFVEICGNVVVHLCDVQTPFLKIFAILKRFKLALLLEDGKDEDDDDEDALEALNEEIEEEVGVLARVSDMIHCLFMVSC